MGLTTVVNLRSSTRMRTFSEGSGGSVYRERSAQPRRKESSLLGYYASFYLTIFRPTFAPEAREVSSLTLRFKLSIVAGWVLIVADVVLVPVQIRFD